MRVSTKASLVAASIAVLAVLTFSVRAAVADVSTAPSNLTVQMKGGYVTISWGVAPHENFNKVHYIWQWEKDRTDRTDRQIAVATDGLSTVPWSSRDVGMVPGTTYQFQVESVKSDENGNTREDENGNPPAIGGQTDIVRFTLPETFNPDSLKGWQSGESVALRWAPGTSRSIDRQHIKRREPGDKGWTTIQVDADADSYTDTDVESGHRYIYRIESWSSEDRKLGLSGRFKIRVR